MNIQIGGVVVGRVKRADDPQGEGRILVEFPWMEGRNQSYWAPLATLMSGGGRGSWFMPEQGDEVLLAFDHGDINHPYIVGFLWNGVDKPPRTDPALRTIQTVSGHVLEFDDNEGKEKISLLFKGKTPSVIFEEKSATIKTTSGHEVKLDDASGESISIKWKGGDPSITMESSKLSLKFDSANFIEISSDGVTIKGAALSINGQSSVSMESTSQVSIQGSMIKLN